MLRLDAVAPERNAMPPRASARQAHELRTTPHRLRTLAQRGATARRPRRRTHPVGYVIRRSCCSGVFVDEAAEAFTSLDLAGRTLAGELGARCGCRRSQAERTMRPVGVVVLHVDTQDPLKLSTVCDQEPIETVTADRADPAFSEGVRV